MAVRRLLCELDVAKGPLLASSALNRTSGRGSLIRRVHDLTSVNVGRQMYRVCADRDDEPDVRVAQRLVVVLELASP